MEELKKLDTDRRERKIAMYISQAKSSADTILESSPSTSDENRNLLNQINILIVEDEEGIRAVLEELLFMEGYKTTSAENGDEGIRRLGQTDFDLVFTDLNMPGVSGRDVAKAVKAQNSNTPVIVVTGWDTNALGADLTSSGVDRILKKPFDMDEVLTIVSDLIKSS